MIIILALVAVFAGLVQGPAWARQLLALKTEPPHVRLTGIFYPLEEEEFRGGIITLKVIIKEKTWQFRVHKIQNITVPEKSNLRLLNDIHPPTLYFRGGKKLMKTLQQPEITGKLITIEGQLYPRERFLTVTTAQWAEEAK